MAVRGIAALVLVACGSAAPPVAVAPVPAAPDPAAPVPAAPPRAAPPRQLPLVDAPPTFPRLPRDFVPTGYLLRLTIARDIDGHVEIAGRVAKPTARIWLHATNLSIDRATAVCGSDAIALVASRAHWANEPDELLALDASRPLPAGGCTVAIDYTAPTETDGDGLVRRGDYVYTFLEPTFARRVVPCVDEPDVKVPWQLSLVVPRRAVAVSNTPIARETPERQLFRRVDFEPTPPLPSYLIAFAVGPFDVVDAGRSSSGVPIRVLKPHFLVAPDVGVLPREVDFYEHWLGVPFPYRKLDVVVVPVTSERWGAMENAGMVAINMRYDGAAWLAITAHEVAHQWFGDLVTPAWWDDIWLNESFAVWAADKAVAAIDPDVVTWTADSGGIRPSPADAARPTQLSHEILGGRQGAGLLRSIERMIGAPAMQRGLHEYLTAHANATVTTADLVSSLDGAAGRAIDAAVMPRLTELDVPMVSVTARCEGGKATADIRTAGWTDVSVCFAWGPGGGARSERCVVATIEKMEPLGSTCPAWIMPDAGGIAAYLVSMDTGQVTALVEHGWPALSENERDVVLASLAVEPEQRLALVPALLATGDDAAVAAAARTLADDELLVPAALRSDYDAWVRAQLSVRARAVGLTPRPGEPHRVAQARAAVALADVVAGDLVETANAAGMLATIDAQPRALVPAILAAAGRTDPARTLRAAIAADSLEGLEHADVLDALIADPATLRALSPGLVIRIVSKTCDADRTHRLAPEASPRAARSFDSLLARCDTTRRTIEPVVRRLLAR